MHSQYVCKKHEANKQLTRPRRYLSVKSFSLVASLPEQILCWVSLSKLIQFTIVVWVTANVPMGFECWVSLSKLIYCTVVVRVTANVPNVFCMLCVFRRADLLEPSIISVTLGRIHLSLFLRKMRCPSFKETLCWNKRSVFGKEGRQGKSYLNKAWELWKFQFTFNTPISK